MMIDVTVKNILFFSKAAAPGYTLFLQPTGDEYRSLPIVVGQFEAQAIALALEQVTLQRPMTHDLLSSVINSLTDGLESVVINDLKAGTFYSQIYIHKGDQLETIDSRPSDAIALALRANVPIRVTSEVFKKASVVIPDGSDSKHESEKSLSSNVKDITRKAELRFDLEKDLREAITREDYEQAAQIRDRLHTLSNKEL